MTEEAPPVRSETPTGKPLAKTARLAREAAALRANLRKRREQARERAAVGDAAKAAAGEPPREE